jgi:hypothetical protein
MAAKLINKEFEDTKGAIRIRKSKDRQHNGQKKNDKRTSKDVQITTLKIEQHKLENCCNVIFNAIFP